jgi:ATP adenylyltransferase
MPDDSTATLDSTTPISYDEIIKRLTPSYERALASGALNFYESIIHIHKEFGVDFEIRLCPALLAKPMGPPLHFQHALASEPGGGDLPARRDPFTRPYPEPDLHIGDIKDPSGESQYAVLLNKFCVVSNHFILTTIGFESQVTPLLPSDLLQVYRILQASRRANQPFFAFYNCGEHSGASQGHKHIQFLPVDDPRGPPVEILAKNQQLETEARAFSISVLPYAHYIHRLPTSLQSPSSSDSDIKEALTQAFINLLDLAVTTLRHDDNKDTDQQAGGPPSYNVLMTLEHLHIIPRLREKFTFGTPDGGKTEEEKEVEKDKTEREKQVDENIAEVKGEKLSVNSLGFAGMLLVKSDKELGDVKKIGVMTILQGVAAKKVDLEELSHDKEFPF